WIAAQQFDFLSLGDGTTYFFRVKARDAARNESAYAVQSTTLDDTAPASAVAALAPVTTSPAFTVAWSGTDATSGVASVDLFVAKDGGAYKLYPGGPWTASPIAFDATSGGGDATYPSSPRATDRAGTHEPPPAKADAHTQLTSAAVHPPVVTTLASFTPGTSCTITWTGTTGYEYLAQASAD